MVGATTLERLLRKMKDYQRRAHPESWSSHEGGSPIYELESWLNSPTADESPRQICEIGLNAGESAVAWLCTFPSASYLAFDLARYNASNDAAAFLRTAFPGRFHLIAGDTFTTLPLHARAHPGTCDIFSVDGGHEFNVAYSDLSYARVLASERSTIVMDDLRCTQWWCKPPTAVWHFFRENGLIHERGCVISGCCTGWCWGSFNRSAPQPDAAAVCGDEKTRALTRHGQKCVRKANLFNVSQQQLAQLIVGASETQSSLVVV